MSSANSTDVTINQLPTAQTLTGQEAVPIVQRGLTVQTTTLQIANLGGGGGGGNVITATAPLVATPIIGGANISFPTVGTMATENRNSVTITGGNITNITNMSATNMTAAKYRGIAGGTF